MPIVQPPSLDALGSGAVPGQPALLHGTVVREGDNSFHEHFSETRDDRLREFHEMNDMPVVGLGGGCTGVEALQSSCSAPARVFIKVRPRDVEPGTRLDELLV
jgi:hypothetical protein